VVGVVGRKIVLEKSLSVWRLSLGADSCVYFD
jgi:hypothetical protein